jgi:TonB-linked SusC/RagA family outer membrane protein
VAARRFGSSIRRRAGSGDPYGTIRETLIVLLVVLPVVVASDARGQDRPATYALAGKANYLPLESVRDGTLRMPKVLARRVVVSREAVPLQQVLLDIATQAGLGLSYGEDLAQSDTRVSLQLDGVTAAEALAAAVRDTPWAVLVTAAGQVAVVPASRPLFGAVSGRVRDRASGLPVAGAELTIADTRLRTVADDSGGFRLTRVPPGSYALGIRRIGYSRSASEVEVTAAATAVVDVSLDASASTLDRVVVTGVPGSAPRRTLGNAITMLDVAGVNDKVTNVNVTELLQSKAPGVMILPGGGTPGTGASIRMRGSGSLVAATSPVIYVDGLRVYAGAQGNFWNSFRSQMQKEPSYGTGQAAVALDMLNPDDIASIEVIKGPAAGTLYGADAANGVIQVITKRGVRGAPGFEWSTKYQSGRGDWAVDRVTNYTTCTPATAASQLEDGLTKRFPGCQGVAPGTILSARSLDLPGALRSGAVNGGSFSVRGGGQAYSLFAGIDELDEAGVFYNSSNRRSSGRANFSFAPSDRLDVTVLAGYSRVDTQFPINDDGFGLIQAAMEYRPGYAIDLTKPGARDGFYSVGPAMVYRYDNRLRATRMTIGTTLNWQPAKWLKQRLTIGLDEDDRIASKYLPPGSIWAADAGLSERGSPENTVFTLDYAGTFEHSLPLSLTSGLSLGIQYTSNQYRNAVARGTGDPADQLRQVTLANALGGYTESMDQKSLGMYVQEQFGWRERLYLTGALRMDNNSVFGADIRRLFYPKVSVSYLLSEAGVLQRIAAIDQVKLRAAWGQAGNAPAPFAGQRSYSTAPTVDDHGVIVPGLVTDSYGNPRIKPERGVEVEGGVDASLFNARLGVELTVYHRTTRDALMAVNVPASTGFPGVMLENLGTIRNRGAELSIVAAPIDRRGVRWDAQLGLSTNNNKLVSFGYDRSPITLSLYQPVQRHEPGYPLGAYWGNFPARDASGRLVHDASGALVADSQVYIGPSSPTREAALGNTLRIGNLRLFGLFDYKGGNYLYNVKDQYRCWGQPFPSAWSRDPSLNVPGACWEVTDPSRSESYKEIRQQAPNVNNGVFIQRADFIKLRELSASYTLPGWWPHRVGASRATVTLAAHNVAILWKPRYTGPDPEVNFTGLDDPGGQFAFVRVDSWTAPMTRRIVASMELGF